MKKSFLFLLLPFFPSCVFCQSLEWTGNIAFSSAADDVMLTSKKQILVIQKLGDYNSDFGFFVLDSLGNELTHILMPHPGNIGEVLEMQNGSTLVILTGWDCDFAAPASYMIFDENWDLTTKNFLFEDQSFGYSEDGTIAALLSTGEFFVRLYNDEQHTVLQKRSADGSLLWQKDFLSQIFYDIAVNSGDTLVIAAAEGLLLLDTAGWVIDTLDTYHFNRLDIAPNGNYAGLSNDSLHYLTPDFAEIGILHFSGEEILDFALSDNQIAVLTEAPKVFLYDTTLQIINIFSPAGSQQIFKAIALREDELLLAGEETYGIGIFSNKSFFAKSYTPDGSTLSYQNDIGVTAVSAGQPPALRIFVEHTPFGDILHEDIDFKDIQITVKNFGNDTIQTLTLNTRFYPDIFSICSIMKIQRRSFQDLNLAPGKEAKLLFGDFSIYVSSPPANGPVEACFWTSLPNSRLDLEPQNDGWCETLLLSETEEPANQPLAIFPNPASHYLNVKLPENLATGDVAIYIFNAAGQPVKTLHFQASEAWQLDVSEFAPGFYFLEIESAQISGWHKFFKM